MGGMQGLSRQRHQDDANGVETCAQ